MSKTLSEELCEICGIVPKLKEDAIQLYDEYYKKFADKILPDFTKSENFVKLLKIYAKHTFIINLYVRDYCSVIDCLLYSVMAAVKFNDDECKALKNEIKQADWNYE